MAHAVPATNLGSQSYCAELDAADSSFDACFVLSQWYAPLFGETFTNYSPIQLLDDDGGATPIIVV